MTLYSKIVDGYYYFNFWTSSEINGYGKRFVIAAEYDVDTKGFNIGSFWPSSFDNKKIKDLVRPVLVE